MTTLHHQLNKQDRDKVEREERNRRVEAVKRMRDELKEVNHRLRFGTVGPQICGRSVEGETYYAIANVINSHQIEFMNNRGLMTANAENAKTWPQHQRDQAVQALDQFRTTHDYNIVGSCQYLTADDIEAWIRQNLSDVRRAANHKGFELKVVASDYPVKYNDDGQLPPASWVCDWHDEDDEGELSISLESVEWIADRTAMMLTYEITSND